MFSKIVLGVCACTLVALVLGYPIFRSSILSYRSDNVQFHKVREELLEPGGETVPGIVVLTGDRARIATGFDLLQAGLGGRLLVSGVNEHTSRDAVFRVTGFQESRLPCCVDIGYSATSTLGNAEETRRWVKRHRITSLLVVTSDYHMPRSLLELSHAMPEITLMPYVAQAAPVRNATELQQEKSDFLRHSLREYGKFLVAHGRLYSGAQGVESVFAAKAASQ